MTTYNDYKQSKYLQKKDVERPILVTIAGHDSFDFAMRGQEPKIKPIIYFKEIAKPLVLNPANNQLISAITGTEVFEKWVGHKIVLFIEPTVSYGNTVTGGIRCRAPRIPGQQKPIPQPQTITEKAAMERAKNNPELMAAHEAAGIREEQLAEELAEEEIDPDYEQARADKIDDEPAF